MHLVVGKLNPAICHLYCHFRTKIILLAPYSTLYIIISLIYSLIFQSISLLSNTSNSTMFWLSLLKSLWDYLSSNLRLIVALTFEIHKKFFFYDINGRLNHFVYKICFRFLDETQILRLNIIYIFIFFWNLYERIWCFIDENS